MMYILIADYLFRTYRYLECLEYAAEILKIDESNHTALFFKGLCGEAVLQYRYNMSQKTMVLIDDIYKSINPNEVHFDKKIVIDKIEHYKKIDTSGWKYIGLCFSKATKEILEDLFWSEEQKFYLANKLYINPLIEIDCYLESTNEWIPAVGISQEVKDLFDSIIKDFKFCRKKIYFYDSCSDKEKLDLVLVFNFLFSLFDKIGYLLYKYFDLDLKDHQTYLHKVFTADMNNTSIKLLDVKNQYLYSLYHISKEYSQTTSFHNPMNKVSKAIKENRNLLTHRGTIMANEDTVYDVSFHLAKVVRRCIIYTNLIFYIEEYRRNLNLPYTDLIFSDYLGNHLVQKFQ
ncbi:MAG: LA2681 family HEPN domain-containing protein [Bacteroidales bacterium]|nr:LA2681 family HEPN domain-containing protein [Bacteroidales bacterium]